MRRMFDYVQLDELENIAAIATRFGVRLRAPLADPFQSVQLPEIIEEFLEQGTTTCIAFNRRGTLLAGGSGGGPCAAKACMVHAVELAQNAV